MPPTSRTVFRPWIEGALLGLALFLLYALGASRTIYVGDSGELVAAVHTLGIPHPTGYPLYVLLGKLWTVAVPLGSVAFRMSLFAAACAAAAAAGLYVLGRRLELARVPALFAALLLAFSPSFWAEANVQRVYSLGALFLVAATTAAVEWHRGRRPLRWSRRPTWGRWPCTGRAPISSSGIATTLPRTWSRLSSPGSAARLCGSGYHGARAGRLCSSPR